MDESALLRIQADCYAEDVPLPEDASEWSETEVRAYFESGGGDVPARRLPLPSSGRAGPAGEAREVESIAIGGVELDASVPEAPELVPWVPTALSDSMATSQDALATARWMMVQLRLGQDMLLLGEPGGRVRLLVLWLCSILRLEVEYVGVTRDTSEADLKQRRELRGGSVLYSDAPPLRAATRGRVLILEGVEKAERNVLPLLNNLLENREMSLDDGSFLAAPSRGADVDPLSGMSDEERQRAPQRAGAGGGEARVRHAKRGFVVIGIGLPQPTYAGNPLDPPLRSRFATRRVRPIGGSEAVRSLLGLVPALSAERGRQVVAAVDALRFRAASTAGGVDYDRRLPFFSEVSAEAVARLLCALPQLSPVESVERRLPLPALRLSPATIEAVRSEVAALLPPPVRAMRYALVRVVGEGRGGRLASAEPITDGMGAERPVGGGGGRCDDAEVKPCGLPTACMCTFCPVDSDGVLRSGSQVEMPAPCGRGSLWQPGQSEPSEPLTAGGGGSPSAAEIGAMGVGQLKALLTLRAAPHADLLEKSELRELALQTCGNGGVRGENWRAWQADGVRLVDSQLDALHAMCQEHALGRDVCILSRRGLGKTTLARRLATLFGYGQPHTVFCHHELPAHELLQRRTTNPNGDTVWRDSPLLTAAKAGGLALLDGIHRLPRGTLAGALATLCTDRSLPTLPDGSRLVSPRQWEQLCRSGLSPSQLRDRGVWRVHPSFRIIATAEPAAEERAAALAGAAGWLNDEVLPLFTWIRLVPPSDSELAQMLRLSDCAPAALPTLRALLGYRAALEGAASAEPSLRGAVPSQRQLLRAADLLRRRPDDTAGALRRATGAALLTVPPAARETAHALLVTAAREAGVSTSAVPPRPGMGDGLGGDRVGGGDTPAPSAEAAAAERARRERQGRETKELEGLAIQRRMMGNFGGMGEVIDAKLEAGVRKMREERRAATDERVRRVCQQAAAMADMPAGDGDGEAASVRGVPSMDIQLSDGRVSIGEVSVTRRSPIEKSLVPSPSFVPIAGHVALLREMLLEWEGGGHLLLLGDQGVGKNKLADKLLQLLRAEREYVQLHRDTTVASLTLAPCLEGGIVSWRDSPLVRAARLGRVLVVDEADKAPLEVVCVLKALAEDGDLTLGDGRRLVCSRFARSGPGVGCGGPTSDTSSDGGQARAAEDEVVVSPAFRMLVLANPPGFPFQGNDFFRECGDVFGALAVPNPDAQSQAELLRRVAPALPRHDLATLLSLFARLRLLHAQGQLTYPYSVRELVLVARHLDAFPDDGLHGALADVFDADAEDKPTAAILGSVLAEHGLHALALEMRRGRRQGDTSLQLEERSAEFGGKADKKPPPMPDGGPKHGEWDGKPHVGGNKYAGGTGGTGTAGLGGRAGPYRLDVGQRVHMLSEAEKAEGVSQEALESAKRMADEAYAERLRDIGLNAHDAELYDAYSSGVAPQVVRMRRVLHDHREKARERVWLKGRPNGELDESRIVDGLAGSSSIYKHRGPKPAGASGGGKRVSLRFVMDLSGSMYTFERLDGRKTRLLEVALFVMQALEGLESTYEWSMVGHSGTGPEAEQLGEHARLAMLKRMEAHTQFCHSGDKTFEASRRAIANVASREADERFVFIISDADLARYGLDPKEWSGILTSDASVGAYAILIASNEDEAARIHADLAPGRGHVCTDTSQLAVTFEKIFQASLSGDG